MILSKIISSTITKGRLLVKVLGLGSSDIKTVYQLLPFGIDSRPVKNYRAVYSDTGIKGEKILIGVINNNVLTGIGEIRIHSEDSSGNEVLYVHLKSDGNCEINGNNDNLVRYLKLDEGLSNMAGDINTELGKIQTAIIALGGTYAKSDIDVDISDSKIDELLTS